MAIEMIASECVDGLPITPKNSIFKLHFKAFLKKNILYVLSPFFISYFTKNAVVSSWNDGFERATLFAEAERECFYEDITIACESYRAKYPEASGFINFSRPEVLNNYAILEYNAELCSGSRGNFVLLEKKNDVWVVINSFSYFVS